MNIVEYAIQMRDFASGKIDRITRSMSENIRMSRRMAEANQTAGNVMGKSFDLGRILKGGAIATAAIAAGRRAGELLGSSMREALEREQIQVSFNVLAGSDAAGKALAEQLVALQRDTILGGEVFGVAQTMMGYGFDSTEVIGNLRMLGDVSMGNADKLQRLALAFSQIRAAGRMNAQDMAQMREAGFNPLQQIAESTGATYEELFAQMERGNISFEMVQRAFVDATSEGGRFESMLAKIAETPTGRVQQLKGMWGEVKVAMGNAFMPLLSYAVELGQRLMPVIERAIVPMAEGISKVTERLKVLVGTSGEWSGLMDAIAGVFTEVWNVVGYVGDVVFGIVADLMEFIRSSTLLRDVFYIIGAVVKTVYGVVRYVIDTIKFLWDNVVMPILNGIEAVWRWLNGYERKATKGLRVETEVSAEERESADETKEILREIGANTKANAGASASAEKAITSGGQRVVNISVAKMFDNIIFNAENIRQVERDIEEVVLRVMSRVTMQAAANAVR